MSGVLVVPRSPTASWAGRTCPSPPGCSAGGPRWSSSCRSSRWPCCGRSRAWRARASGACCTCPRGWRSRAGSSASRCSCSSSTRASRARRWTPRTSRRPSSTCCSGSGCCRCRCCSATCSRSSTRGARSGARSAGCRGGVAGDALPEPMAYPEKLGRWPAAIGILCFAWLELVSTSRSDPSTLSVLILAYAAIQLVGMSLYGVAQWERYGDAFAVYFNLFARLSPLRWERGTLYVRALLSGVTTLDAVPGTVALLCTMIGTTTFDGFSNGPVWSDLAPEITDVFTSLGFGQATALQLAFTVGLLAVVAIVSLLYRAGAAGMRSVAPEHSTSWLARDVRAHAHADRPRLRGRALLLVPRVPGPGARLPGVQPARPHARGGRQRCSARRTGGSTTRGRREDHLVRPGRRARPRPRGGPRARPRPRARGLPRSREATRSQYWMLVVMVAFTSLGLWLLSVR